MRLVAAVIALLGSIAGVPAMAQVLPPPPGRPVPPPTTDKEDLWLLDLSDGGRVTIWLRPDVAPKMVERIKKLTRDHFYDGIVFHRVLDENPPMAQAGDPKGDGSSGSDLPDVPAEFNYLPHVRGAVSAARLGAPEGATPEQKKKAEDSANSQFFIMFAPALQLDQKYTVFGRVIDGMQWVDKIQRGEPPLHPTRIVHAYIAADNPPPYKNEAPVVLPAGETLVTLPGADAAVAAPPAKPKK